MHLHGLLLRRITFGVFLATLLVGITKDSDLMTNLTFWFLICHVVYFELPLPVPHSLAGRSPHEAPVGHSLHGSLAVAFHGLSFVGSWLVAVLATLLVFVYDPSFLKRRAAQLHISLTMAYLDTALVHWLPPVLATLDLFLHRRHLAAVHGHASGVWTAANMFASLWFGAAPTLLGLIWMATGHSMTKTYGANANHWASTIPIGVATVVAASAAGIYVLRSSAPSGSRAHGSMSASETAVLAYAPLPLHAQQAARLSIPDS